MWCPVASAFSLIEFSRFRAVRKRLVMLRGVLSQMRWRGLERLPDDVGKKYAEFALGYYIYCVK